MKAKSKITSPIGRSPKSTENREKPTNQHGTKPAKTVQKKDYSSLLASLDHLWYLTRLDVIDMANDQDDWRSINLDRLKPIVDLTYREILKQSSGFNIDHKALDEGIKEVFNDLGDVLCKNLNSTELRGELIYKISGTFESLRFRLEKLAEKVLL